MDFCQLDFSKNIFLPLNGWPCSLFICVYFLSPSEQITIAFQKLAQQSNPLLHYILCYEHSVLRGGGLGECSFFLALLLPCPSVSVSSFLSVPTEPCNYRWMPSYSPLSTPYAVRVDGG